METFVCPNTGAIVHSPLQKDNEIVVKLDGATMVSALRMRFPADRQFVFEVDADGDSHVSPNRVPHNNIKGT